MDSILKQLQAEHERMQKEEEDARRSFAVARAKRQAISKALSALTSQDGNGESLTRSQVREAVVAVLRERGPQSRDALKKLLGTAFSKGYRKPTGLGLHLAAVLKDFTSSASGLFTVEE